MFCVHSGFWSGMFSYPVRTTKYRSSRTETLQPIFLCMESYFVFGRVWGSVSTKPGGLVHAQPAVAVDRLCFLRGCWARLVLPLNTCSFFCRRSVSTLRDNPPPGEVNGAIPDTATSFHLPPVRAPKVLSLRQQCYSSCNEQCPCCIVASLMFMFRVESTSLLFPACSRLAQRSLEDDLEQFRHFQQELENR